MSRQRWTEPLSCDSLSLTEELRAQLVPAGGFVEVESIVRAAAVLVAVVAVVGSTRVTVVAVVRGRRRGGRGGGGRL